MDTKKHGKHFGRINVKTETGLLWFDSTKGSFEERIQRATAHYQKKFGVMPSVCYIPLNETSGGDSVNGIPVRRIKGILPNHIWLCKEDQNAV